MATLQKIRNRGKILIFTVGLALFAFIAEEFVRSLSYTQTERHQRVGKIYGDKINVQDFNAQVEEYTDVVKFTQGVNTLNDDQLSMMRDQVWQTLVNDKIMQHECEKLGITVTDAEMQDIINNGRSPMLAQTPFRTQQGTFDVNALKQFLNQYNEVMTNPDLSSEVKEQYQQMNNYWKFIEKTIRRQTLNNKYQALLNGLMVSNPVAAKASFEGRTNETDIYMAALPFTSIKDDDVKVEDSELKAKYEELKELFRADEETRDIKYIDINVTASEADKADLQKEMEGYAQALAEGADPAKTVREAASQVPYSVLPVSAKTGDSATITFDYCYDTGGGIITFAKTVTNGSVTVGTPGEELCRIYADGKDAYCIEPGYSLYSGNTLTEGKSSVWNGIPAATRKAVNIALLYGKPGNSKNLGYTDGQQWIATQLIVWELISGCRNTNEGFKCTNTKYIDGMCAGDKNPGVKAVYNKISSAMATHSTVPSFAAVLASKAPTHTMEYKDGKYQITLTDNNGVLSKFAYKTSGNIAVSISGNKMTLATNSPITEPKTLAINKNVPTVSGNSVLVAFGDSSKQDVITGLAAPDPVPSVFKLKTSGGHLKIVKTAEDGNISGIEFTVTGTNFNKTAKTDDKGELVLAGLVPGTYTVTETPSDKYVKQPAQIVTVENGKTATVSFNNKLDRGDLKIIKTSEDNIVANIQFTVTGTNFNQTAKTDKDGIISLTNLLPGTYTVTEAPSDKYEEQAPQTVKVEYSKTAEVKFHNKIDRGGLDIIKTSEDGIVADIEFTVTGDNFNQTVKTDKNGKINIPNLLPGKYTVTEKTPDRYVDQQSQTVTVENGKTAKLKRVLLPSSNSVISTRL